MSNNRLYFRDKTTGELLAIAKSMGTGWDFFCGAVCIPEGATSEEVDKLFDDPARLVNRIAELQEWLTDHDGSACYGNCDEMPGTNIEVVAESEMSGEEKVTIVDFEIPHLAIISEANDSHARPFLNRERKRKQQQEVMVEMRNRLKSAFKNSTLLGRFKPPFRVTLVRIGPKTLDSDNLANSFKAVQDQIARELGVDDGDSTKVHWAYKQEATGTAKAVSRYALKIKIESLA